MAEPVIPDFGEASDCVAENRLFCTDWVRENWDPVLQPALVEHIKLTLIAVGVGFVHLARRGAARAPLPPRRAAGRDRLGGDLHDPEPRALPAARPRHRADRDDGRDRARRLHAPDPLPQHPRRAPLGAARGARGGARDGPDPEPDALARRAAAGAAGDRRRAAHRGRLDDRARDRGRVRRLRRARRPDPRRAPARLPDGDHRRRARSRSASRSSPTRCSCSRSAR